MKSLSTVAARGTATGLAFASALAVFGGATACARPDAPVASAPTSAIVADVSSSRTSSTSASTLAAPPSARPAYAVGVQGRSAARLGNQHVLGPAAFGFAKYINDMHNRIHPPFTDEALQKLDALGPNDPLNNMSLMTRVELMIDGRTGNLVKQTVVGTSGIAAFDELAIEAVRRAAPFGPADPPLWSSDGNVYIHWEFRRDPILGCSVWHTRPFLLDIWSAPRDTP